MPPLDFCKDKEIPDEEDPLQLSMIDENDSSSEDSITLNEVMHPDEKNAKFKCTACDQIFSFEILLLIHVTKQLSCIFCNEKFCNRATLISHIAQCSKEVIDSPGGKDPAPAFADKTPLKPYEAIEVLQSIRKTGKCLYCSEEVDKLPNLKLHLQICHELCEYMKKKAIYIGSPNNDKHITDNVQSADEDDVITEGVDVEAIVKKPQPKKRKKYNPLQGKTRAESNAFERYGDAVDSIFDEIHLRTKKKAIYIGSQNKDKHITDPVQPVDEDVEAMIEKLQPKEGKKYNARQDKTRAESNALERYGYAVDSIFDKIHLRTVNQSEYPCEICKAFFRNHTSYKNHMNVTHGMSLFRNPQRYSCVGCHHFKRSLKAMNEHLYTDHESMHQCQYCPEVFSAMAKKRCHILSEHPGQPAFDCNQCDLKFFDSEQLRVHLQWHSFEELVMCTECGKQFKGSKRLAIHKPWHRKKKELKLCPLCGKIVHSHNNFYVHMHRHHGHGKVVKVLCPDCGILTGSYSRHRQRWHSSDVYQCSVCSRDFKSKYILRSHEETHVQGRPHRCNLCSCAYKQFKNLQKHMRSHHQSGTFVNPAVEKMPIARKPKRNRAQYDQTSTAAGPEKMPTVRKLNLKCPQCEKTFTTAGTLNSHQKWVHSGDRNFSCAYCPAKFKRRDAQIAHERRHTNEKPYSCRICGRTFRQSNDCKRHESRHAVLQKQNVEEVDQELR